MFEFRLPDVGEGVAEGEIVAWHVEPGDAVAEDQVLAEVETDKAVVDLPSPVAGTVQELHAAVGDVVPVGEVVVTIDPTDAADSNVEEPGETATADAVGGEPGDGPSTDPTEAVETPEAVTSTGRVFAPPSVRRLAREHGIDLGTVAGSGPGGRVTAADVRDAAGASGAADADVEDAITEVAPEADVGGESSPEPAPDSGGSGPKSAIRRRGDGEESSQTAGSGPVEEPQTADRDHTLAAPATRGLADDLGVDLDAVPTEKARHGEPFLEPSDVEAYAEAQQAAQEADAAAVSASTAGEQSVAAPEGAPAGRETREPYRGVRRTIGRQMEESAFTVPHVTHHDQAVVTSLVEARDAMQSRADEQGIRMTYVPFVLKAVVAGLKQHPVLNTSLDEDSEEVVYKHYYDLGVATATDAGLMVPVVENAAEKGILQLASEVNELVEKARERSIAREEMQGGTFTITNFGAIGGEYATPIINHPETAILGLGSIEQRPVVVDGEVEARDTLPLSLSIDHRVIDGADAARFANTVIEYLENPSLLLLE